MIAGMFVLTTQDVITKWLTAGYHAGEIMFYRGLFSFLPLALFVWREGGPTCLRTGRPGLMAVRSLLALATSLMIVLSYAALPLADALAIVFASPLIITALSAPLLGESVGPRRWAAVAVGFMGVLLLTRPGPAGIALTALIPLSAALFSALRDLVTRRLGAQDSSTTILFYSQLVSTVGVAPSMVSNHGLPPPGDLALLLASGIMVTLAHYLIIQAFRFAPAATVAPFRYLALVWAMIAGFVIWRDVPDAWALGGSCLIVGSGLYMLQREARRA